MKVQDEFLGEKEFKIIQNIMLGGSFTWGYSSVIDYSDDKDRYQFCHHFYNKGIPISNYIDMLNPLLEKINAFQIQRIKSLRKSRNNEEVNRNLKAITDASYNSENLTPLIIEAAKSYATLGEIVDSMKIVFGEWEEMAVV